MVSGKIGLASKLDFFNGDYMGGELMEDIEVKIKEIEKKYLKPPKKDIIKKSKKHRNKQQKKKH
jgi:RNA processing factor Prp31